MFKRLALLFPALALSACVVVIGDDDADLHFDDEDTIVHSERSIQHSSISNRIEDAIHADSVLKYADISVSNKGQVTYLHGEVFEPSHIQHAVNIALADVDTNTVSSRIILTIEK